MASSQVIPWYYYYFFGGLEPVLEVVGAYLCIFTPQNYVKGLLPPKVERTTLALGGTLRGKIACGILGSYFFTFSLVAFAFFPLVTRQLGDSPRAVERLTRGYLAILAICDLMCSIVVTLLPMPAALLRSPSQWTVEIHGNISITIGLFIVRSLWFLGVGRVKPVTPDKVEKAEQGPSLPAGIATGWYYIFAVIEPLVMITAALGILFVPGEYGRGLLPERYERPTSGMGNTVRGQMVLGGLGSCLILTSLVQLTMFPLIKSTLKDQPDVARRMINGLLGPLAICDALCAFVAFRRLPSSLSDSPGKWTWIMYINIVGRMVLLALRVLYVAGGEAELPTIPEPKKIKRKVETTSESIKDTAEGARRRTKKAVE